MYDEQLVHIEKELRRKQLLLFSMNRQIKGLLGIPNAVNSNDYLVLKNLYNSTLHEIKDLREKKGSYRNAA
jgi:hypothetical protein